MSDLSYRKSLEYVEVYIFNGENHKEIEDLFKKYDIKYEFRCTEIPFDYKTNYYLKTFTFEQDRNVFFLDKGMYLVRDSGNSFSTYKEERFKKLFDKVYSV